MAIPLSKAPHGLERLEFVGPKHRYVGKYRFDSNDAKQMAEWSIDYLQYDWRIDIPMAERMSVALKQSGCDILYSISNSAPFAKVNDWVRLTNSYRTAPDIRDSWNSLFAVCIGFYAR